MSTTTGTTFLTGVIEGFYGTPWTEVERLDLLGRAPVWGFNTYFYGPKDDLHHRALWRQPYGEADAATLGRFIRSCSEKGIRFIYALGPGLDIRYSHRGDIEAILRRFQQLMDLGCRDFCLLFDDIPDALHPEDRVRWGSFASAHAGVANEVFHWVQSRAPGGRFLFCPTPYCGRMASRQLGGPDYLTTLGRELSPQIDIFWTGPEIVSAEITVAHIRELAQVLRRKPLLWDNLHANDYDGHRFFCGPYAGRSPELRGELAGILTNPNTEYPLNRVALETLGAFVRCTGPWNPRAAYLESLEAWLPGFASVGKPIELPDLVLLMDCFYLPHELGPEARDLFQLATHLMPTDPSGWGESGERLRRGIARLRELCVRLTELRDRSLFNAMGRRIWELREELDLLERYWVWRSDPARKDQPFASDFHQPRTYRGSLAANLQRLWVQQADGTLSPRSAADAEFATARLFAP
jgi:beta-N-acetylglucosaminidase